MAKQQQKSGMNRFYGILAAVAIVGIAIVGYQVGSSAGTVSEPVDLGELTDQELTDLAQGMVLGSPDAPVTIFEFGDYQCPSCRIWFQNVKNLLDVSYIQTGKVKFVYYDWPITQAHPNAFLAARASRCAADQDLYWEYHKSLFDNQGVWANLSSPVGQFTTLAEAVGVDGSEFEACLESAAHADVVTAQMRLGGQLGVGGTPTVLITKGDGRAVRPPSQSYEGIVEVLEEMLATQ